ncbi:hypothetical protein TSMEX_009391 [Taenia solium]|eukprot:TsM_001144000 transcript=TsM_001144000 gene=TsM_001144000
MKFGDSMKTVMFNIHLYPWRQRVPLILRALPQELCSAATDARVSSDAKIDKCCETLSKLVNDQRKQSLTSEFSHRDQKTGEDDERYARNLQLLVEQAFRGTPPNRVTN